MLKSFVLVVTTLRILKLLVRRVASPLRCATPTRPHSFLTYFLYINERNFNYVTANNGNKTICN